MRAIFYARGPDIRPRVKIAPFENVNIFPLIVRILSLNEPRSGGISKNSREFFKIQQKRALKKNIFFLFLKIRARKMEPSARECIGHQILF